MIHRRIVSVDSHYSIALTTEEMKDGGWAVVVTVMQATDGANRHVDLPITHQRFDSEAEAEEYGLTTAREWIEQNTPHVL
jgi:hypothetical protein